MNAWLGFIKLYAIMKIKKVRYLESRHSTKAKTSILKIHMMKNDENRNKRQFKKVYVIGFWGKKNKFHENSKTQSYKKEESCNWKKEKAVK